MGEAYAGRVLTHDVGEDLLCFPVLSFVIVGRWVIGRLRNGPVGGLLEPLLCLFVGFIVLTLLTVHSTQ